MAIQRYGNVTTVAILGIACCFFISACSVVGMRSGTEQPSYTVIDTIGVEAEVRLYAPRLTATVTIDNLESQDKTRNKAFSILADYIFGNNNKRTEISMTAPVAETPRADRVSMTAPVAEEKSRAGKYMMAFFLPADISLDKAPVPNDDRIEIVEIPATNIAALIFRGSRDSATVAQYESQLLTVLRNSKWAPEGNPVAYFYDPPWTIPSLRRNEVAVAVKRMD